MFLSHTQQDFFLFRIMALCKCYYLWCSVGWNKGSHTRFAQVWGLLWRLPLCIRDVISLTHWLILQALKAESDWSSESDTQFSWKSIYTICNSPALISPSSCMAGSRVSNAKKKKEEKKRHHHFHFCHYKRLRLTVMPSFVLLSHCHSSSVSERLHPDSSLKISWIHTVEISSQIYSRLLE